MRPRLSSNRDPVIAARLGLAASLGMFGLIVIGSVVRTTGSGLACPDWPLCQGKLIPPFEFHVLIEWLHRAAALLVSLLVTGLAGWVLARRELRATLGGLAALALVLLFSQVLLGALTVWKLLSPTVVSGHLAIALLLFSCTLIITAIAETQSSPPAVPAATRPAALLPVFGLVCGLTYAQAVLGGMVSSSHAGLACPDWPTCNGEWFPPLVGLAGLQMLHRYGAYAVTAAMVTAAVMARSAPDPGIRAGASTALALNVAQVVLGVSNVLLGTPPWLSAAHLATAAAMLALLVLTTYRVASLPAREARLVAAPAP